MNYKWPFSPKNSVKEEREKAARYERARVRALKELNKHEINSKAKSSIVS